MVYGNLTFGYHINITTITGSIVGPAGIPISYARVFFYPSFGPSRKIEADINGFFSFDCIEGEEGSLVIVELMYDKKLVVPPMGSGNYSIDYRSITPETRFDSPLITFNV